MTDEEFIGGANDKQVAGTHYKKYTIQPWDAIVDWQLGFLDGCAVKYISRWKDKGGVEDIKKAIHFLEKLLETQMDSKLRKQQFELQSDINKTRMADITRMQDQFNALKTCYTPPEPTKEEKNRWGGIP